MQILNLQNVPKPAVLGYPLKISEKTFYSGFFYLKENSVSVNKDGIIYREVELHNAHGKIIAKCNVKLLSKNNIKEYESVEALIYMENIVPEEFYIQHLVFSKSKKMENLFLSLPREMCAEPAWLDRLINIRQSIKSPSLIKFLEKVFSDEDVAMAFIKAPASINHHHNRSGGLLAHSVEVAEIVADQKFESDDERDIAVIAGLLHDIGKVWTLSVNLAPTTLGRLVAHDGLTLEICALALKELDKSWLDAAYTLRHVWTCATPGARYGYKSMSTIANIVRYADKLSTDRNYFEDAFEHKSEDTRLAWADDQFLWRPRIEPISIAGSKPCQ